MSVKQLVICLVLLLSFSPAVRAQDTVDNIEQIIADIFEQYTAETEETIDYDSFYENLMYCAQNPINLNQATREQMEKLPFLSETQVESILWYIYRNKSMQSIYELRLIKGLDMTDIRRMLPFVALGEINSNIKKIYWRDVIKYGRNELYFRLDKGLETKEGYRQLSEDNQNAETTTSKKYLGNDLYHSLKYNFHFKDRILIGFAAEKDGGEQFWGAQQKGYDFYSFHTQLNNIGKFKTIVLGDYRANFGQGLVLHPEFGMGKSSYVLNVTQHNSGLKKYSSMDESNFFRGAGTTVKLNKFDLTAFFSNKMLDGDTVNGTFSTNLKTGYHRTLDELSKKHTVNQKIQGGNITYTNMNVQIGATLVHTRLDNALIPDKSVYNYFYFCGKEQTTAGLFYRCRWQKLNLFGETAVTDNSSVATLNGFSFTPVSRVSLVALYRYYPPEYDTFYASSFSESSRVNNESGLYLGAEVHPFKKWKFAAYADNYRFMWPKFGIDAPSIGRDYLFQADFVLNQQTAMFWRFKFEEKQTNLTGTDAVMPVIVPTKKASLRYQLAYSSGSFLFKNVLEGNLVNSKNSAWTYGVIASQDLSYTFALIPLRFDFRFQVFDAVDYENRFYSYEKDVLHAFSIPMYFGLGSRYYLNLKYDLSKSLSVWFKLAQTVYADDRELVSSGNETIQGNRKTDIRFLLKWEF